MDSDSKFQVYLKKNLQAAKYEQLIKQELPDRLGSPHRRTKLLREPEQATHAELLEIAAALRLHPYSLLIEYRVGAERLSELEKASLQEAYKKSAAKCA